MGLQGAAGTSGLIKGWFCPLLNVTRILHSSAASEQTVPGSIGPESMEWNKYGWDLQHGVIFILLGPGKQASRDTWKFSAKMFASILMAAPAQETVDLSVKVFLGPLHVELPRTEPTCRLFLTRISVSCSSRWSLVVDSRAVGYSLRPSHNLWTPTRARLIAT